MRELFAYSTMAVTMGIALARPRIAGRWQVGPAHAAGAGVLLMLGAGIVEPSDLAAAAATLWRPFITIVSILSIGAVRTP